MSEFLFDNLREGEIFLLDLKTGDFIRTLPYFTQQLQDCFEAPSIGKEEHEEGIHAHNQRVCEYLIRCLELTDALDTSSTYRLEFLEWQVSPFCATWEKPPEGMELLGHLATLLRCIQTIPYFLFSYIGFRLAPIALSDADGDQLPELLQIIQNFHEIAEGGVPESAFEDAEYARLLVLRAEGLAELEDYDAEEDDYTTSHFGIQKTPEA